MQLLALYHAACNVLDIPHDARFLTVTEYKEMIATVRQKALNGEKVKGWFTWLFPKIDFSI